MIRRFNGASGVDDNAVGVDQGINDNVKLVQRGETTWGTAVTKAITLTIPIDPSKSVVNVKVYANTTASVLQTAVEITNATTITLTRTTGTNNAAIIYWEVIEYTNVKSKQTGTATGTSALTAITVNKINPSKSILVLSHRSTVAATTYTSYTCSGKITSATSISLLGIVTSTIIYWQLLEFY